MHKRSLSSVCNRGHAVLFGIVSTLAFNSYSQITAQEPATERIAATTLKIPKSLLQKVFAESHDGWSLDEVLLSDDRRAKLLETVAKQLQEHGLPAAEERDIWEGLVRLRKAGNLSSKTTQRETTDYGDALPAAEIAARRMQDQYELPFDQILVNRQKLDEYDMIAREIGGETSDVYTLRKAAMKLRKSRDLKPELVLRVNDWKREIETMSLEEARANVSRFSTRPGVYIFRDSTGYLYIGQSNNLRERLSKHLEESDRKQLAKYLAEQATGALTLELHVFTPGSPAEKTLIREAYESELIRSRKPRLNVAP